MAQFLFINSCCIPWFAHQRPKSCSRILKNHMRIARFRNFSMIITHFLSAALVVFVQRMQLTAAEMQSEKAVTGGNLEGRSSVLMLAKALAAMPRSKRSCNGCGGGGCNGGGCSNNGGCSNGNCHHNRENTGRNGGASTQASDLGLRELLALLPYLSQARVPLTTPLLAPPPIPAAPMPFVAAAANPGGNIVRLGRALTRRQIDERTKRSCNGCGGNGGGCSNGGCSNGNCNNHRSEGGSPRTESSGLSLRELLMILPFLSQARGPLPVLASAPVPAPPLPLPMVAAASAPGGDIVQLARTLTRRQVKKPLSVRSKRNCNGCGGGNGCNGGGCGGNGGCSNGGCNGSNNGGCPNGHCNNNRNSGSSNVSSRNDSPGLSLRELLLLLPFLSQRPIPLSASAPAPGADAITQLARVVTRRQAGENSMKPTVTQAEMRAQLRRLMMEEARRMASIVVTPHPTFGPNLAVLTTTIPPPTTTWPRTTPVPPSEIVDDYDLVPEPVIDPRKGKVSPGDPCNKDSDCVPGAQCQRGAVAGIFKYCVCRLPLMGFDGLCVLPGSPGVHHGH